MYDLLYSILLQLFDLLLAMLAWLGPEGTFAVGVASWLATGLIKSKLGEIDSA